MRLQLVQLWVGPVLELVVDLEVLGQVKIREGDRGLENELGWGNHHGHRWREFVDGGVKDGLIVGGYEAVWLQGQWGRWRRQWSWEVDVAKEILGVC